MLSAKFFCATACALCCCTAALATDDPMRPMARPGKANPAPVLAPAPPPRPDWVLSSTLVGDARRVAVINDRLVGVGDEVLGALVVGIDVRSAQLRYAGQDVVLHLGERRAEQPIGADGRGRTGQ